MYKLIFYVPEESTDNVKNAVFETGAGTLGLYSHCSWQTLGMGQFKPLSGSNPTIGSQGQVESVQEYRVEVLCTEQQIRPAIAALKQSHPYEEVAFEVISVLNHECD